MLSPPFRQLSEEKEGSFVQQINQAAPDVLWVGLGLPKQEEWISRNLARLRVAVTVAVGAAFKLVARTVKPTPRWVRDRGLEWIWRFSQEPRRLARRVLVYGPVFMWCLAPERISTVWRRQLTRQLPR